MIEHPPDIWGEPAERSDRVTCEYLEACPPSQSLYLLRVQNLQAKFDWSDREGFYRERFRALFFYQGQYYELNITDPRFIAKHRAMLLPPDQPAAPFVVNNQQDTIVCVSLVRDFNGYHYKVVATIFA